MSHIVVAIRVRPSTNWECSESDDVVTVDENTVCVNETDEVEKGVLRRIRAREYAFDHCFGPTSSQEEVFTSLSPLLLNSFASNRNGSIIAYGQTGSGKTFTMLGDTTSPGLIPRICEACINSEVDLESDNLEVSFYEIYNDKVRDLLSTFHPSSSAGSIPKLRVREHPVLGPYIQGLTWHDLHSSSDLAQILTIGCLARTSGATAFHSCSSRSHAIFTVRKKTGSVKMNFVDLAGSERHFVCGTKDQIRETAYINKSLATLGSVILALSARKGRRLYRHIPYRDSTITWLLKDSIGGQSKTIMIGTVAPSSKYRSETLNTLRYANKARNIVNRSSMIMMDSIIDAGDTNSIIRDLRAEIARLKSIITCAPWPYVYIDAEKQIDPSRGTHDDDSGKVMATSIRAWSCSIERTSRGVMTSPIQSSDENSAIIALEADSPKNSSRYEWRREHQAANSQSLQPPTGMHTLTKGTTWDKSEDYWTGSLLSASEGEATRRSSGEGMKADHSDYRFLKSPERDLDYRARNLVDDVIGIVVKECKSRTSRTSEDENGIVITSDGDVTISTSSCDKLRLPSNQMNGNSEKVGVLAPQTSDRNERQDIEEVDDDVFESEFDLASEIRTYSKLITATSRETTLTMFNKNLLMPAAATATNTATQLTKEAPHSSFDSIHDLNDPSAIHAAEPSADSTMQVITTHLLSGGMPVLSADISPKHVQLDPNAPGRIRTLSAMDYEDEIEELEQVEDMAHKEGAPLKKGYHLGSHNLEGGKRGQEDGQDDVHSKLHIAQHSQSELRNSAILYQFDTLESSTTSTVFNQSSATNLQSSEASRMIASNVLPDDIFQQTLKLDLLDGNEKPSASGPDDTENSNAERSFADGVERVRSAKKVVRARAELRFLGRDIGSSTSSNDLDELEETAEGKAASKMYSGLMTGTVNRVSGAKSKGANDDAKEGKRAEAEGSKMDEDLDSDWPSYNGDSFESDAEAGHQLKNPGVSDGQKLMQSGVFNPSELFQLNGAEKQKHTSVDFIGAPLPVGDRGEADVKHPDEPTTVVQAASADSLVSDLSPAGNTWSRGSSDTEPRHTAPQSTMLLRLSLMNDDLTDINRDQQESERWPRLGGTVAHEDVDWIPDVESITDDEISGPEFSAEHTPRSGRRENKNTLAPMESVVLSFMQSDLNDGTYHNINRSSMEKIELNSPSTSDLNHNFNRSSVEKIELITPSTSDLNQATGAGAPKVQNDSSPGHTVLGATVTDAFEKQPQLLRGSSEDITSRHFSLDTADEASQPSEDDVDTGHQLAPRAATITGESSTDKLQVLNDGLERIPFSQDDDAVINSEGQWSDQPHIWPTSSQGSRAPLAAAENDDMDIFIDEANGPDQVQVAQNHLPNGFLSFDDESTSSRTSIIQTSTVPLAVTQSEETTISNEALLSAVIAPIFRRSFPQSQEVEDYHPDVLKGASSSRSASTAEDQHFNLEPVAGKNELEIDTRLLPSTSRHLESPSYFERSRNVELTGIMTPIRDGLISPELGNNHKTETSTIAESLAEMSTDNEENVQHESDEHHTIVTSKNRWTEGARPVDDSSLHNQEEFDIPSSTLQENRDITNPGHSVAYTDEDSEADSIDSMDVPSNFAPIRQMSHTDSAEDIEEPSEPLYRFSQFIRLMDSEPEPEDTLYAIEEEEEDQYQAASMRQNHPSIPAFGLENEVQRTITLEYGSSEEDATETSEGRPKKPSGIVKQAKHVGPFEDLESSSQGSLSDFIEQEPSLLLEFRRKVGLYDIPDGRKAENQFDDDNDGKQDPSFNEERSIHTDQPQSSGMGIARDASASVSATSPRSSVGTALDVHQPLHSQISESSTSRSETEMKITDWSERASQLLERSPSKEAVIVTNQHDAEESASEYSPYFQRTSNVHKPDLPHNCNKHEAEQCVNCKPSFLAIELSGLDEGRRISEHGEMHSSPNYHCGQMSDVNGSKPNINSSETSPAHHSARKRTEPADSEIPISLTRLSPKKNGVKCVSKSQSIEEFISSPSGSDHHILGDQGQTLLSFETPEMNKSVEMSTEVILTPSPLVAPIGGGMYANLDDDDGGFDDSYHRQQGITPPRTQENYFPHSADSDKSNDSPGKMQEAPLCFGGAVISGTKRGVQRSGNSETASSADTGTPTSLVTDDRSMSAILRPLEDVLQVTVVDGVPHLSLTTRHEADQEQKMSHVDSDEEQDLKAERQVLMNGSITNKAKDAENLAVNQMNKDPEKDIIEMDKKVKGHREEVEETRSVMEHTVHQNGSIIHNDDTVEHMTEEHNLEQFGAAGRTNQYSQLTHVDEQSTRAQRSNTQHREMTPSIESVEHDEIPFQLVNESLGRLEITKPGLIEFEEKIRDDLEFHDFAQPSFSQTTNHEESDDEFADIFIGQEILISRAEAAKERQLNYIQGTKRSTQESHENSEDVTDIDDLLIEEINDQIEEQLAPKLDSSGFLYSDLEDDADLKAYTIHLNSDDEELEEDWDKLPSNSNVHDVERDQDTQDSPTINQGRKSVSWRDIGNRAPLELGPTRNANVTPLLKPIIKTKTPSGLDDDSPTTSTSWHMQPPVVPPRPSPPPRPARPTVLFTGLIHSRDDSIGVAKRYPYVGGSPKGISDAAVQTDYSALNPAVKHSPFAEEPLSAMRDTQSSPTPIESFERLHSYNGRVLLNDLIALVHERDTVVEALDVFLMSSTSSSLHHFTSHNSQRYIHEYANSLQVTKMELDKRIEDLVGHLERLYTEGRLPENVGWLFSRHCRHLTFQNPPSKEPLRHVRRGMPSGFGSVTTAIRFSTYTYCTVDDDTYTRPCPRLHLSPLDYRQKLLELRKTLVQTCTDLANNYADSILHDAFYNSDSSRRNDVDLRRNNLREMSYDDYDQTFSQESVLRGDPQEDTFPFTGEGAFLRRQRTVANESAFSQVPSNSAGAAGLRLLNEIRELRKASREAINSGKDALKLSRLSDHTAPSADRPPQRTHIRGNGYVQQRERPISISAEDTRIDAEIASLLRVYRQKLLGVDDAPNRIAHTKEDSKYN